jgi:chaperonin GroEL (HSP60 family)
MAAASTVVVDPAKVVRTALLDAASVADLLITIERCANGNFRSGSNLPVPG